MISLLAVLLIASFDFNTYRFPDRSKPEYYSILDLPMTDDTQSIYDCFDVFTNIDIIHDFKNDNNKNSETVNKQIYFWSFPKILILCLKRYNNNIYSRCWIKPLTVGTTSQCI